MALILLGTACDAGPTDGDRLLVIAPAAATLFIADTTRFTATLRDREGNVLPATPSWASADTAIATVDDEGLVRGRGPGATTITATFDGMTAEGAVVVSEDDGLVIALEPVGLDLVPGDSGQLQATVRDRDGEVIPMDVEWTSSNTGVATVSAEGWVRGVAGGSARIQASAGTLVAEATVTVAAAPAATILAAGDISKCDLDGDEETATLLDGMSGTVLALGDNVYERGTLEEFENCYHPTWGRHKDRTRPVPGNHEYETSGAGGYFESFGSRAGDPARGYYSFDLGGWHIIALNSNIGMEEGSTQERWLREDLRNNDKLCTLAYWHHPLFSSGSLGTARTRPLWEALYEAGADLVLTGHEHNYERFAPQTPDGEYDAARGVRQITVGTGGAGTHGFNTPVPNSEVRDRSTYGVIKLTLHADRYEWEFVPVAGSSFRDSGSGSCR
jgi:hypothetical protein